MRTQTRAQHRRPRRELSSSRVIHQSLSLYYVKCISQPPPSNPPTTFTLIKTGRNRGTIQFTKQGCFEYRERMTKRGRVNRSLYVMWSSTKEGRWGGGGFFSFISFVIVIKANLYPILGEGIDINIPSFCKKFFLFQFANFSDAVFAASVSIVCVCILCVQFWCSACTLK